jgi:hypothetical protein
VKRLLVGGAVLALGITGMGLSQATPAVYKVTGGGQILDTGFTSGAGDQISFTAQSQGEEGEAAKGQFTYHDRQLDENGKGTGKGQTTVHGDVTCVVVYSQPTADEGGRAVVGGETRDGRPFRIDVIDNGQGGDAEDDLLRVSFDSEAEDGSDEGDEDTDTSLCDMEKEDVTSDLGRGNVKIHKEKAA